MIPARRLFLALGTISLGIVGAVVVEWMFPLCLALDAGLLILAFLDSRLAGRTPLELERIIPSLLSQGRSAELEIRIYNPGTEKLEIRIRDGLHPSLAEKPPSTRAHLPQRASLSWKFGILPRRRGEHRLYPISLRILGPLGLAWCQRDYLTEDSVIVYPQIRWGGEVGRLLRMAQQHQLGEISWQRRGATGEAYALREYIIGDPMRRIHWKASARHGHLIVREDSLERGNSIFIMLDAARAMAAPLSSILSKFDEALGAALVMTRVASARRDRASILVFSDRIEALATAGGGRDSVKAAYRRLYDLQPRLVEPAFDLATDHLLQLDRRRGIVIILTSMADLVGLEQLEESLYRLRKRHQVLLINLEDPELEALAMASPSSEEEAFAKASALKILLANRRASRKFRAHGIRITSTPAPRFAAAAISGYLDALIGDSGTRRRAPSARIRRH